MSAKTILVLCLLLYVLSYPERTASAFEPSAAENMKVCCCDHRQSDKNTLDAPSILYSQIMTPMWIKTHASYLDPTNSVSSQWLSFLTPTAKKSAVLFKVSLLQPGQVTDSTPLAAEVTVALDKNIGAIKDSDITFLLCDGDDYCYGIFSVDKGNYADHAPCYGTYGSVANHVFNGAGYAPYRQDSTQYGYPAQYALSFRLREKWVSCMAYDNGGFYHSHGVPQQLRPSKGLSLVVTKSDLAETVAIGMIKVTVEREMP